MKGDIRMTFPKKERNKVWMKTQIHTKIPTSVTKSNYVKECQDCSVATT